MEDIKPSDYSYYVINIGNEKEDAFKAIIPKFPNINAYGDTPEELNAGVMAGIEVELECLAKEGKAPPLPDKKSKFNGKILIRVPPGLHEELYYQAHANNLSLNKYIESKLQ